MARWGYWESIPSGNEPEPEAATRLQPPAASWHKARSTSTMSIMTNRPARRSARDAVPDSLLDVPAMAAIGAVRLPFQEPNVQLWRVPLRVGKDALAGLVDLLPADERKRMDAIRDGANRRRFAVAHGALRLLLAHHLRERPRALVFAAEAHGKPYLPGARVEFNLTHAHELALIALSLSGAVGVDVERRARRPVDLQAMVRRVLSPPEQEWLAGTAGDTAQRRVPAAVDMQGSGVQGCGQRVQQRLFQHLHRAGAALSCASAGCRRRRRPVASAYSLARQGLCRCSGGGGLAARARRSSGAGADQARPGRFDPG